MNAHSQLYIHYLNDIKLSISNIQMQKYSKLTKRQRLLVVILIGFLWIIIGLSLDRFLLVKGEGVVTNNNHGCYVDGVCSLTVDSNGTRREIIYEIGWGACNYSEAEPGAFEIGDEVKFYAQGRRYSRKNLSICENPDYYIIRKAD